MSFTVAAPTLADLTWPRSDRRASVALIVAATLLTALAAQVAIPLPWTPVPLTGQTFAVLLSGAVLGCRRGFLAQVLYVALGGVGLPFFAGGTGGALVLAGPTGGYLVALPLAAGLTGWLAERGFDRRAGTMALAMVLGSAVIYALGLAGLARFVATERLLVSGLYPFLAGDLLKAGLAALALPRAWDRAGSRRQPRG